MVTPTEIAFELESQLIQAGVAFGEDGFPIPDPAMVCHRIPTGVELHTIDRLCEAHDLKRTIGVSFLPDKLIYRRLEHLEEDIPLYRELMAFGGFDLSPRVSMPPTISRMNLLINMMATIRVGLSGVPLIPNFRTGGIASVRLLSVWPKRCPYVVGTLGCARGDVEHNLAMLKAKLLIADPSELLIYGTLQDVYRRELDEQGTPYRVFADRRSRGFGNTGKGRKLRG